MTISGTIEQAPSNAYYFTDIRSNDILFRAFAGASYCFGAGSNVPCMMRVNSNNITMIPANNVGIGTSNPQSHLHVYNATTSPVFLLDGGGFGNRGTFRMITTNAGNMIQSGSQLSNDSRADIVFSSMLGTTEFVRIRGNSGNVGIGTVNPQSRLEVNGSAAFGTVTTNSITTSNISAISPTTSNIDIGCDITTQAVNIACSPCNQTVNIGNSATGQTTINIGGPSDIIRISGSLQSVQTTDLEVTDSRIILNKNGTNAVGVGFDIEESNSIVGYIKTSTSRSAFLLKTPAGNSEFTLDLAADAVNMNSGTFVLANGGNVGVGTPTPLSKFHVSNGDITISHSFGTCALRIFPVGDTSKSFVVRGNNENMEIESVANSNGRIRFLVGSNTGSGIPQEVLSLTHTGRVGIGTSNPQNLLDVNGATRINNTLVCYNSNNTADGGHITIGYANRNIFSESNGSWNIDAFNSNLRFFSLTSTAQSNFGAVFTESGNMGLVTTNTQVPATKLDVYGTTTLRGGTSIVAPNNNQLIFAPNNADNNKHLIRTRHGANDDTSNAIDIFLWQQNQTTTAVGNKHVMSITNPGVGIYTSNPGYPLDVLGSLRTSSLQYMNRASSFIGHWRLNSNITHNNGAALTPIRAAWSNNTTTSFNESSLLDTDGRLNAPVAGIYTASFAMRFPVNNTSQCWFEHTNTFDRLGWQVTSSQNYSITWTGFLDAGWKLAPVMWHIVGSTVTYSLTGEIIRPQLHFALIQPLV